MVTRKIIHLTPEQLRRLQYVATIESIGASMRLAGSKISNREVERILLEHNSIRYIIRLVEEQGKITMADIITATNAPRSTIKKQLASLVDQKYLARHGKSRAIWYTKAR